jgi:hypothetical protein
MAEKIAARNEERDQTWATARAGADPADGDEQKIGARSTVRESWPRPRTVTQFGAQTGKNSARWELNLRAEKKRQRK